jgi:hypothetical protein
VVVIRGELRAIEARTGQLRGSISRIRSCRLLTARLGQLLLQVGAGRVCWDLVSGSCGQHYAQPKHYSPTEIALAIRPICPGCPGPGIMRCTCHHGIYTTPPVKLNRKAVGLLLVPALVAMATGCSGINSSHSVSPATFLLPGLLQYEPKPADSNSTLPEQSPDIVVAQAR